MPRTFYFWPCPSLSITPVCPWLCRRIYLMSDRSRLTGQSYAIVLTSVPGVSHDRPAHVSAAAALRTCSVSSVLSLRTLYLRPSRARDSPIPCEIVHRTSSPCRSHDPRLAPIPGGVPVMMTVPGGNVVPCERYATILV
jgi:hypothetical protein